MQSRSRILVIDDDPMFRSLVVSLLRKDYLVSVAADGESGFSKAREHRPDLAIIDYQMPGWNGIKTLQLFRKDRTLSSVKVMMLTSDASKETVLSAIQAGTNEYIIKTSFNKADFLAKVQKLLIPTLLLTNSADEEVAGTSDSLAHDTQAHDPLESPDLPAELHREEHSGGGEQNPTAPYNQGFHSPRRSVQGERSSMAVVDEKERLPNRSFPSPSEKEADLEGRLSEIMDEWED